jgi:acetyltransferase-like isoleucine patch superfamily enzyme
MEEQIAHRLSLGEEFELTGLRRSELTNFIAHPPHRTFFSENNFIYLADGLDGSNIRVLHHGRRNNISDCQIVVLSGEGNLSIRVGDSGARVYIGKNAVCRGTDLRLWRSAFLVVDDGCTINSMRAIVDHADVVLERDCMLSDEILLQSNDQHAIIDLASKRLLNGARRSILIGEHAWIGRRAILMPDAAIGKGSIVATGAIVTQNIPDFCAAAGVPARVVREGVSWSRGTSVLTSAEVEFFKAAGHTLPTSLQQ